jgi:hypothetical protein
MEKRKKISKQPSADDEQDETTTETKVGKKKKKKKAEQRNHLLLIGVIAGVVLVVLLAGGGVSAYFLLRKTPEDRAAKENAQPQANADDKKSTKDEKKPIRIVPPIEEGNPAKKKGGDSIVNNVRGAGWRLERKNDLKQIGLAFIQFCDDYKGSNRTQENFMKSNDTLGPLRDYIKEGYYVVNMKARLESSSIIAYENALDQGRYLCVLGNGEVDYLPEAEWKKLLGKP